jgi:hypothetical protein
MLLYGIASAIHKQLGVLLLPALQTSAQQMPSKSTYGTLCVFFSTSLTIPGTPLVNTTTSGTFATVAVSLKVPAVIAASMAAKTLVTRVWSKPTVKVMMTSAAAAALRDRRAFAPWRTIVAMLAASRPGNSAMI